MFNQQSQYQQPDPKAELLTKIKYSADLAADKFRKEFYLLFDSNREFLPHLFIPSSSFIWDGMSIPIDKIKEFLVLLPVTSHDHVSVDCQPILLSDEYPPQQIVINVVGDVKHGSFEQQKGYTHQFIIEKQPNNPNNIYFIRSFIARLLDQSMHTPQPAPSHAPGRKPKYHNPR